MFVEKHAALDEHYSAAESWLGCGNVARAISTLIRCAKGGHVKQPEGEKSGEEKMRSQN